MFNETEDIYEYEDRFVAFIDILGFKEFILNDKAGTLIKVIKLLDRRRKVSLI